MSAFPLFAFAFIFILTTAHGASDRPQYIIVNMNYDCANPSSFSQSSIDAVLAGLNSTRASPDGRRRLGISFDFWVMYSAGCIANADGAVDALLALALSNDLPLSLSIDATQWWQGRPDLYNWWDDTQPGYNPLNRENVEWTTWSPTTATSLCWRNWGSQFRMPSPPPNFASISFRSAAVEAMRSVAVRVAAWYRALPPNKTYLLAYVRSTQELWQGTNYYVYKNATRADGTPSWPVSQDPTTGLSGTTQIGYAALCSSGKKCSGVITAADQDHVISSFLAFASSVLADAGIPRSRLMGHTGSFFGKPPTTEIAFNTPAAAISSMAAPGWSLYGGATNAQSNAGLDAALGGESPRRVWWMRPWVWSPHRTGGTISHGLSRGPPAAPTSPPKRSTSPSRHSRCCRLGGSRRRF